MLFRKWKSKLFDSVCVGGESSPPVYGFTEVFKQHITDTLPLIWPVPAFLVTACRYTSATVMMQTGGFTFIKVRELAHCSHSFCCCLYFPPQRQEQRFVPDVALSSDRFPLTRWLFHLSVWVSGTVITPEFTAETPAVTFHRQLEVYL